MTYRDRTEAGRVLAEAVVGATPPLPLDDVAILGVVRGGVPVAAVVAAELGGELGPAFATKLGAPGNPELAVGALADDEALVDSFAIERLGISPAQLEGEVARRRLLLEEKRAAFAGYLIDVAARPVLVVDDGVATGHTIEAVAQSMRRAGAAMVYLAVPVGPPATIQRLATVADRVICPLQPIGFRAVGAWYREFPQLSDEDVLLALGPSPDLQ